MLQSGVGHPTLRVSELKQYHVEVWIDAYNLSITSRRNYLGSIKRCLKWATGRYDSTYPFSQGLPLAMNRVCTPAWDSQRRTEWATNSGPLSLRKCPGAPRMANRYVQHVDHITCCKRTADFDRQAFPGVFVDHDQQA